MKIFNLKFILKFIKWSVVQLAWFSMVIAPVAMGQEAQTLNKKYLQETLKEFGLNKKTTLGEFWEKSKGYMPRDVYKDFEEFVKNNKNMLMPEVAVDVTQATDGAQIPVLTFSQNGKTSRAEFYGENDKWLKYNGVNLSSLDLTHLQDAFLRLEASDIKLKNEAEAYRKSMSLKQQTGSSSQEAKQHQKDFSRFEGFPRITPQMWRSLNKEQRVGYIVKMRLMWMSARKVLSSSSLVNGAALPNNKTGEVAALENFYKIIFGQNAEAAATKTKTKVVPFDAKACVVAGYIGAYGKVNNVNGDKRPGCSIDLAVATYRSKPNLKFVQEANDSCAAEKPTSVACNPIIYGFPGGKPACIDRRSSEYQQATHFSSQSGGETCDGKSRLSSSDDIIKFNTKDYSTIQPLEKQINVIEADQQQEDYSLTQSYIKGVLNKKDPSMSALLEKGEWNIDLDNELVGIQSQFEQEIEKAINACETNINSKHEKNQKSACDQLHRRWLFTERSIAKLREKACVKPASYVGRYDIKESSYSETGKSKTELNKKTIEAKGTDLCQCPTAEDPTKIKRVSFAESCSSAVVLPEVALPVVVPPVPVVIMESADGACLASGDKNCKPEKESLKCDKPTGIAGYDYEQCKCGDNKKLGADKYGGYECEGTNWLYWALGGLLAAGVLAAIFHKNKKSSFQSVALAQPPHSSGPHHCRAPMTGTPPNCACLPSSSCTSGQQIYHARTCQCTYIPQAPVCADETLAPNGNLSHCPTCPNGSFKTTAGCPVEGGNGNNCPQGNCSGGLPGIEN